jgi:predicted RNase H-like HicB family nuclease
MKEPTPQENKALSYAKDRRNNYGKNDKASRKLIPLRKAKVNRNYRRKVDEILKGIGETPNFEAAELAESSARALKRNDWKKSPDTPLGAVIEQKLELRESHAGNGKIARKKIREFVERLTIETELEVDGRWIAEAKEMNGVLVYGETEESAIEKCKSLARAVHLEEIGAGKILNVDDDYISVETY